MRSFTRASFLPDSPSNFPATMLPFSLPASVPRNPEINRHKNTSSFFAGAFSSHSPLACPACTDAGRERMRSVTSYFPSRLLLPATNPPGKRFLIETVSRIEIPVSYRKQRTGPFLIATRNANSGNRDFSSREGVLTNKMWPFQLVDLRGEADECSGSFGYLYLVRRSRTLSLSTFPSTVFPSRRARAALITAPICFNESAPASAMACSMAWWTS